MLPGQISLTLVLHFGQWCLGFDCRQDSHVAGLPKVNDEFSFCCYIQALPRHRFPGDAQWELVKWNEIVSLFFFFQKKRLWYGEVVKLPTLLIELKLMAYKYLKQCLLTF